RHDPPGPWARAHARRRARPSGGTGRRALPARRPRHQLHGLAGAPVPPTDRHHAGGAARGPRHPRARARRLIARAGHRLNAKRDFLLLADLTRAETETVLELAARLKTELRAGRPCQVLSDCFTLLERRWKLAGLRVAFIGDGNIVVHSWMDAAARLGFELVLACPPGYEPDAKIVAEAGPCMSVTHDPETAARGADVIYTDVWTSMGQEAEAKARHQAFRPYQVNERLVALAGPGVLVMHCLPAHRGEEITDAVIDGPQSVVFDQAENRLHV